ncbi:hypothetical protein A2U01_0075893, partial [Trifolium medium]|nr:hypothetical protein [Trifolium medium]
MSGGREAILKNYTRGTANSTTRTPPNAR